MKMSVRERFPSTFQGRVRSSSVWIALMLLTVTPIDAIRLTSMTVPRIIDYKEKLDLDCRFDMGTEELYAVKWYKDDQEFFRFAPKKEPYKLYPLSGIYVDKESSHCDLRSCHVRLTNLMRHETSGAYRCEVSSEAPTFRLASETHNVTVAALPTEKPTLGNIDASYFVGDIVSVVCDSSPSDPPQQLTWYINDQQVPDNYLREVRPAPPNALGLRVNSLKLRFSIEEKHVKAGSIILKCVSAYPELNRYVLSVSKTVKVVDQNAQINNEKFSWSGSPKIQTFSTYSIVVFLAVLRQYFN